MLLTIKLRLNKPESATSTFVLDLEGIAGLDNNFNVNVQENSGKNASGQSG
jgi:hypothetical protein